MDSVLEKIRKQQGARQVWTPEKLKELTKPKIWSWQQMLSSKILINLNNGTYQDRNVESVIDLNPILFCEYYFVDLVLEEMINEIMKSSPLLIK